ncbi:MAG: ABC transporter substrate-binding protein [Acidimicrobiia bacterium]|nr:ABC transporter substrate-binding protein [Acidimicrobiia bacterium]MDH3470455.1 ABC transporter substrate-binding protein [Acidimicrobiia bacterium]
MRIFRKGAIGATFVALALVAAACGSGDDASGPKEGPEIVVSSFDFGESEILAEVYAQAMEANGYTVERQLRVGSREILKPALESGEVDFAPEYVGSALEVGFEQEPTSDTEATRDALIAAFEPKGVAVLDAAPAQDKNGIVVTAATADALSLTTTSDLAGQEGDLAFGGPPECPTRPRCLLGLQDLYGLSFAEFKALDVGGPLTVEALDGGEIDVALLFTTDGVIADRGFVLLEDDLGLQPAENIVPVIRQEILDAYGDELAKLINEVSAKITTEALTEMNRQAGIDLEDPDAIAAKWLADNGFGA